MTTVLLISRPFSSIKLSGIEIGDYNRLSDWLGVWGQAGQKTQEKHLPLEWGKGNKGIWYLSSVTWFAFSTVIYHSVGLKLYCM